MQVGMWIGNYDDGKAAKALRAKFDYVSYMVTDPNGRVRPIERAKALLEEGHETLFTWWTTNATDEAKVQDFLDHFDRAKYPNLAGIEFEAEHNWNADKVAYPQAGSITCLPHRQWRANPQLVRVAVQGYGVRHRREGTATWEGNLGPAAMAAKASRLALRAPHPVVGLPAYDILFPNHTEAEAVDTAIQTVADLGIQDVCYWSEEWLQSKKNVAVRKAVEAVLERRETL